MKVPCEGVLYNLNYPLIYFQTKGGWEVQESSAKKFMRPKSSSSVGTRPRPKTIHLSEVDSAGPSGSETPRHGTQHTKGTRTSHLHLIYI